MRAVCKQSGRDHKRDKKDCIFISKTPLWIHMLVKQIQNKTKQKNMIEYNSTDIIVFGFKL